MWLHSSVVCVRVLYMYCIFKRKQTTANIYTIYNLIFDTSDHTIIIYNICTCMYPIVERDITTLSWPEAAVDAAAAANRRAYPKLATPAQQEQRKFAAEEIAKRKDVAKMSVKPIKLSKIAKYIRKKVKSNNKKQKQSQIKPNIRKEKESSASTSRGRERETQTDFSWGAPCALCNTIFQIFSRCFCCFYRFLGESLAKTKKYSICMYM